MMDEGARCEDDDRLRRALRTSGLSSHHAPVASTTMKPATANARARSGSGVAEGGAAADSIVVGAGEEGGGGTYNWLTKAGLNSGVGRPTRHHRVPVGRERECRPLQPSGPLAARGDAPPPTGQQSTEGPGRSAGDTTPSAAADLSPGHSFPRSSSADSMFATKPTSSLATGPSASYTSAVAMSPATRKRGGGKTRSGLGMRRGRTGGGSGAGDEDDDEEDEDRRISFRDATLVAWLNSVLFVHDDEGSSSTTSR